MVAVSGFDVSSQGELRYCGVTLGVSVVGSTVDVQFEVESGYIVGVFNDCPYEGSEHFYFLDRGCALRATAALGRIYTPGFVSEVTVAGDSQLHFSFFGNDRWLLTARCVRGAYCLELAQQRNFPSAGGGPHD